MAASAVGSSFGSPHHHQLFGSSFLLVMCGRTLSIVELNLMKVELLSPSHPQFLQILNEIHCKKIEKGIEMGKMLMRKKNLQKL